jgi:hypothetical protein
MSRADEMSDFDLGNQLSDWFRKEERWSDMAQRVRALFANPDTSNRVCHALVFVLRVDVAQPSGTIETFTYERTMPLDNLVPRLGERVVIEHNSLGVMCTKVDTVTWRLDNGPVIGLVMGRPITEREASIVNGASGWELQGDLEEKETP